MTMKSLKIYNEGFPGGSAVKNLPVSTADRGRTPDPGRSHVLWSRGARAPQF